jgi:Fe-S cluster assembly protein SufD
VVVQRRSRKPVAPRYTRDDVVALSEANNEPQWLRDMRLQAWETYETLPMPHLEEEWRRTDYSHINWSQADAQIVPNGAGKDVVPAKNLEPLVGDGQGG